MIIIRLKQNKETQIKNLCQMLWQADDIVLYKPGQLGREEQKNKLTSKVFRET
jgi:hypothetical protein